jgi:hypothetical protein
MNGYETRIEEEVDTAMSLNLLIHNLEYMIEEPTEEHRLSFYGSKHIQEYINKLKAVQLELTTLINTYNPDISQNSEAIEEYHGACDNFPNCGEEGCGGRSEIGFKE